MIYIIRNIKALKIRIKLTLLLALLLFVFGKQSYSQGYFSFHTLLEGNPLSISPMSMCKPVPFRPDFDQTMYWVTREKSYNQDKIFYNFHSLYIRDSIAGVRIYGVDFDMLRNPFESNWLQRFRYWNKWRMGFSFMMERNMYHPSDKGNEIFNYINGEAYISWLHLPQRARGDQRTQMRAGSFMFYLQMSPSQHYNMFFKFKPVGIAWIRFNYEREYDFTYYGLFSEFEVSRMGYDHSTFNMSKDSYQGLTVLGGLEMNTSTNQIYLRIGLKLGFRNH